MLQRFERRTAEVRERLLDALNRVPRNMFATTADTPSLKTNFFCDLAEKISMRALSRLTKNIIPEAATCSSLRQRKSTWSWISEAWRSLNFVPTDFAVHNSSSFVLLMLDTSRFGIFGYRARRAARGHEG